MPQQWTSSTWKKPKGWDALALKVKRRAGFKCEWVEFYTDLSTGVRRKSRCTNGNGRDGDGLAADHIVPVSQGGGDELGNLRALCHEHHTEKTQQESAEARRRLPKPRERFRREESHPGLLDPSAGGRS